MKLLYEWVLGRQRLARVWGRHAFYLSKLVKIQRAFRKYSNKGKAKIRIQNTYNLQRLLKGMRQRKIAMRKIRAIPVLQRLLPMYVARFRFRRYRRAIIKL